MCSEGIIVAGYGQMINGVNLSNIRIAGNSKPQKINSIIEDTFYYVDTNRVLRAIIPSFQSGIINFSNVIVEKYDYVKKEITWIERMNINENDVLAVNYKDYDLTDIYSIVEAGLFRKYSLKLNKSKDYIISHEQDYISGNFYHKLTNKNVDEAKLVLNLPFIQTKLGGVYLNDYLARFERIVLNIYSPNKTDIKTVLINEYPLQNLSTNIGNYNIYDFLGTIPILNLSITIQSNDSFGTVEVRGINGFLKGGA